MSTIAEIEAAIENLPAPQMDELAIWLDGLRAQRNTLPQVELWLNEARGVALSDATTSGIMAQTRGEG